MSSPVVLEEPLVNVVDLLPIEHGSVYTMNWRGGYPWLTRRGKKGSPLFVDLLAAADFWETRGRRHVAARLRDKAAEILKQRALAASLKEAAGQ